MKANRGFTLLEVMVALAIAAIGLGAIAKSMITSVDVATRLKERHIATWVASNRLAELRINRQFTSSGSNSGEAEMAGIAWVYRETFATTPDPNISKVDIAVYLGNSEKASTTLSAYLARYKEPEI